MSLFFCQSYVGTLGYANHGGSARVNFDLTNEVSQKVWKLDLQTSANRGEKVGSLKMDTPWECLHDLALDYRYTVDHI